eukprot:scaffold3099_cov100-Isochrysis_galbana.AAC.19
MRAGLPARRTHTRRPRHRLRRPHPQRLVPPSAGQPAILQRTQCHNHLCVGHVGTLRIAMPQQRGQ